MRLFNLFTGLHVNQGRPSSRPEGGGEAPEDGSHPVQVVSTDL